MSEFITAGIKEEGVLVVYFPIISAFKLRLRQLIKIGHGINYNIIH